MHDLYTRSTMIQENKTFLSRFLLENHENRFEIVFQENSSLNQTDFNANLFKVISDNRNKKFLVYNPKLKSLKSIKLYGYLRKRNLQINGK